MKESKTKRKFMVGAIVALMLTLVAESAGVWEWEQMLADGKKSELMDSLWASMGDKKAVVCDFYKANAEKLLPRVGVGNLGQYKNLKVEGLKGTKVRLEGEWLVFDLPENGRDGQPWKCGPFLASFRFVDGSGKEIWRAQRRIYPFVVSEGEEFWDHSVELPIVKLPEPVKAVPQEVKKPVAEDKAEKKTATSVASKPTREKEVATEKKEVVTTAKPATPKKPAPKKAMKELSIREFPIYPEKEEIECVKIKVEGKGFILREEDDFKVLRNIEKMGNAKVEIVKKNGEPVPVEYRFVEDAKGYAFTLLYRTEPPKDLVTFLERVNESIAEWKKPQRIQPSLQSLCKRIKGSKNNSEEWLLHLQTDDKCDICAELRKLLLAAEPDARKWDLDLFWKVAENPSFEKAIADSAKFEHSK